MELFESYVRLGDYGDLVDCASLTCGKQQSSPGTLRCGCRTGRVYPPPYTAHTRNLWLGIAEKKSAIKTRGMSSNQYLLRLMWSAWSAVDNDLEKFRYRYITIDIDAER